MWKLIEIEIKNIVSFKEAALQIQQGVATLIFGKNEDNASQPCNGSGKSSLIEAISFALTGEQLRKVKSVEEIINDQEDEASVRVTLENSFNGRIFIIERNISRGKPQTVNCKLLNSKGKEICKDKTIQPSIANYNRFILDEIGLSKEDIYNNYILCDNKFKGFFDSSDTSKKEVINRFCNGSLIDESIELLQKDMEPIEAELNIINSKVSNIEGSISALRDELANVENKKLSIKQQREEKINYFDALILNCRNNIETIENEIEKGNKRLDELQAYDSELDSLEKSDKSLLECYMAIKEGCAKHSLGEITDYEQKMHSYQSNIEEKKAEKEKLLADFEELNVRFNEFKSQYDKLLDYYNQSKTELEASNVADSQKQGVVNTNILKLETELEKLSKQIDEKSKKIKTIDYAIERANVQLSGVITCPNCNHKFLAHGEETLEEVENKLNNLTSERETYSDEKEQIIKSYDETEDKKKRLSQEYNEISSMIKSRNDKILKEQAQISENSSKFSFIETKMSGLKRKITDLENSISTINNNISILRKNLFNEVFNILDNRFDSGQSYVDIRKKRLDFEYAQLKQHQKSKKEYLEAPQNDLEASLKLSLEEYQSELKEIEKWRLSAQNEYDELQRQEYHFTQFKSYIARKKINALSHIVNDFLEKIGSDIRLRLEGFTVNKTGKIRDRISVQIIRDGIDCGSYQKFSGGEKARLNLACILSLHTLTNINCEDGKGLDFVIIDELLDKSDEEGIATYCNALNNLNQTALLITQGSVSEAYPHKLLITKRQGVSSISN